MRSPLYVGIPAETKIVAGLTNPSPYTPNAHLDIDLGENGMVCAVGLNARVLTELRDRADEALRAWYAIFPKELAPAIIQPGPAK